MRIDIKRFRRYLAEIIKNSRDLRKIVGQGELKADSVSKASSKIPPDLPLPKGGITLLWQRGAGEILQNVSIQFRDH